MIVLCVGVGVSELVGPHTHKLTNAYTSNGVAVPFVICYYYTLFIKKQVILC